MQYNRTVQKDFLQNVAFKQVMTRNYEDLSKHSGIGAEEDGTDGNIYKVINIRGPMGRKYQDDLWSCLRTLDGYFLLK